MNWNLNVSTWNYLCSYGERADLERAIFEIKEDGFGLELWLNWTPDKEIFNRKNWRRLKKWVSGIPNLTLHSQCSSKNLEEITEEIKLAAYLKSKVIVVHLLNFGLTEEQKEIDCQYLNKVLRFAQENKVILALENGYLEMLQKVLQAAGRNPSLGICIDIGHAHIPSSSGLPEGCSDATEIFLKEFSQRIVHLHLADNFGKGDKHLIPGKGSIPWSSVTKTLKKLNYQNQATLELNTPDARKAAAASRNFLNKLP